MQKKVLVTGSNGQLGLCLQALTKKMKHENEVQFIYKSSAGLDITNLQAVENEFANTNYTHCINCAAYTKVDLAEKEVEKAQKVNTIGPKNLAIVTHKKGVVLIHISTDFVFNGQSNHAITEKEPCAPLSVYGKTKWQGEKAVTVNNKAYFILRTSWLYSEYGHNFMKTMLVLAQSKKQLSIVADQTGTPTYAMDLANVILQLVYTNSKAYGIYHYSNQGHTTWYGFAKAIFELSSLNIRVLPITTAQYPTPAKRPAYSVLDTHKLRDAFGVPIPYWQESLQEALNALKKLG